MRSFAMRLALALLGAVIATIALVLLVREAPRAPTQIVIVPKPTPVAAVPKPVIAKPHTAAVTCMSEDMVPVPDGSGFVLCPAAGSCMTPAGDDVAVRPTEPAKIPLRDVPHHKPHAEADELDLYGTAVLGDRELVVRQWYPQDPDMPPPPWAPPHGKIVDRNGVVTAKVSVAADVGSAVVDVGDDGYMILDDYGGFRLVVGGKISLYGELRDWHVADSEKDPALARIEGGNEQPVHVVRLADDPRDETKKLDGTPAGSVRIAHVAASWCDDGQFGCYVAQLDIGFDVDTHGKKHQWIQRPLFTPYPYCHS